jgi:hypothetical protein
MHYYNLQKNWRKITRHLNNPTVSHALVRDFNLFTMGTWATPFTPGMLPEDVESCDWRCEGRRGPMPHYWRYVKHSACHWVVNFTLQLAQLVEPKKNWCIVTSDEHSTVWDGGSILFDFNFQALGISATECWQEARYGKNAKVLDPGSELSCFTPAPYFWSYFDKDEKNAALQAVVENAKNYIERLQQNQKHLPETVIQQLFQEAREAIHLVNKNRNDAA